MCIASAYGAASHFILGTLGEVGFDPHTPDDRGWADLFDVDHASEVFVEGVLEPLHDQESYFSSKEVPSSVVAQVQQFFADLKDGTLKLLAVVRMTPRGPEVVGVNGEQVDPPLRAILRACALHAHSQIASVSE